MQLYEILSLDNFAVILNPNSFYHIQLGNIDYGFSESMSFSIIHCTFFQLQGRSVGAAVETRWPYLDIICSQFLYELFTSSLLLMFSSYDSHVFSGSDKSELNTLAFIFFLLHMFLHKSIDTRVPWCCF